MKPEPPINIEHRVDIVERLRFAHQHVTTPWLPSIYSAAADEIERLRNERPTP